MPLRSLNIYEECDSGLGFAKIRSFLKSSFPGFEIRIIKTKKSSLRTKGIIFDLQGTQGAFLKAHRQTKDTGSIILSEKIFATLDDFNRPHIRASIYSYPCIISLSGIVEGPAKPKEFYTYKQRYSMLGTWQLEEARLKKKFAGQFIDYQDKRMTEVVKGYIAQVLFFYLTGNPFCEKRGCRLFNAHWQRDLIYSQITGGKFCRNHRIFLDKIRKEGNYLNR
jgi:hypothetical protein